jgi:hypothetical protein
MNVNTSNQEKFDLGFHHLTRKRSVHFCGFHKAAAHRDEIILGFLNTGDMAGYLQFYCLVEQTTENLPGNR